MPKRSSSSSGTAGKHIASWIGGVVAVLSLVAGALGTWFTYVSLTKEEISQLVVDDAPVSADITLSGDGPPAIASNLTVVLTNTGRLPITIVDLRNVPGPEAVETRGMEWIRLEDSENTIGEGPFLLSPGEAVVVTVSFPSKTFYLPLQVVQSDGQVVGVKSVGDATIASENIQEKIELLSRG